MLITTSMSLIFLPEGALGKGRGWHYVYEDQTIIDEDAECPDHPTATVEHFVVLSEEIT